MKRIAIPVEILSEKKEDHNNIIELTKRILTEEKYCTFEEVDLFEKAICYCSVHQPENSGLIFKISNN